MADTSIGVSSENWERLNRYKNRGESFDNVLSKLLQYDVRDLDDGWYELELPRGYIFFDCFSVSGDCINLKKEQEYGYPLEIVAEINHRYDDILTKLYNKGVPVKVTVDEDNGLGLMKDENGELGYTSRFHMLRIKENSFDVLDKRENERISWEIGEEIIDQGNRFLLERIEELENGYIGLCRIFMK